MVLSPVRSASVPPRQATRSKLGDSAEAIEDASNVLRGPVKEYEVACYLKQVVGMLAEATREIRYISRCNKELVEQNNKLVGEVLKLRNENSALKCTIASLQSSGNTENVSLISSDLLPSTRSVDDVERSRFIVLSGVPESNGSRSVERVFHDLSYTTRLLDLLNVFLSLYIG